MIPVEKPGSPSEILEHHGVKGMKWGVRNRSEAGIVTRSRAKTEGKKAYKSEIARARSASGQSKNLTPGIVTRSRAKTAKKAAYKSEIARARASSPNVSANAKFKQKFPTSATRTRAIKQARVQEQAMRLKAASETNPAKRDKLVKAWMDSPDRAIALRTTRGEKVVLGVLAGALAVPTLGGSVGVLAGYSGASVAIRRGIERGQAKRARQ